MKKTYTALFLPDVYSKLTKTGFKRVKDAEFYIKEFSYYRFDWLVIDTNTLEKHLTVFDEEHSNYAKN